MRSLPENPELAEILREGGGRRALVLVEEAGGRRLAGAGGGNHRLFPEPGCRTCRGIHLMPGGEAVKADDSLGPRSLGSCIDAAHLDRHSYVLAIGGGAFLDAVGFAAATAHRGVRLVRFPTTTLSQDDSGVGVKCAINAFGKKNWIGAFAVPFAVINDFRFLHSQDEETRRGGLDRGGQGGAGEGPRIFRVDRGEPRPRSPRWSPRRSRPASSDPRCCTPATSPRAAIRSKPAPAGRSTSATGRPTSWRR